MTTYCKTCKKEIEPGAIKCCHCDSYQNWRRYLALFSAIISTFIAVATVFSISIPATIQALKTGKSNMHGAICSLGPIKIESNPVITQTTSSGLFPSSEGKNQELTLDLSLAISNLGDRSGILLSYFLELQILGANLKSEEVFIANKFAYYKPDVQNIVEQNVQLKCDNATELGNFLEKSKTTAGSLEISEGKLVLKFLRNDLSQKIEVLSISHTPIEHKVSQTVVPIFPSATGNVQ